MLPRPQRPHIGFPHWISSSNVKCLGTALQCLGHCLYTLHFLTSAASISASEMTVLSAAGQRSRWSHHPGCFALQISQQVVHNFDCFFALQTQKMISFDQQQYNSVRLVSSTNSWLLLCAIVFSRATNDPGSRLLARVSFSSTNKRIKHA